MEAYYFILLVEVAHGFLTNSTDSNTTDLRCGNSRNGNKFNATTKFEDDSIQHVKSLWYLLQALTVLMTVVTVIGNFIVIGVVINEKKLRKVGNVFIINLALSGSLVGFLVNPLAIIHDVAENWIIGKTLCNIWVTVDTVCCTAGILNLSAIAYDRCNAIVHPMSYARKRTFKRACITVTFVWIYSLMISLPNMFGWNILDKTTIEQYQCHLSRNVGYAFYSTFGAFYIPLLVVVYLYSKIYRSACLKECQWKRQAGNNQFIGHLSRKTEKNLCQLVMCSCCPHRYHDEAMLRVLQDDSIQVSKSETIDEKTNTLPDDVSVRRESIEPELMAIYRMRQRSPRMLSNVTVSSFGSTFSSSIDSSNTATNSISEGSDRSNSISTEGRDRSSSSSTEGSRSLSWTLESNRRCRTRRLSSCRQNSFLHNEVIHEIATAKINSKSVDTETEENISTGQHVQEGHTDTDETHDEASEDGNKAIKSKQKVKVKLFSFRYRNSRRLAKTANSQEKRAATTLGIMIGCYVICWMPFFLIAFIIPLCMDCFIHPIVIKCVLWLGYANAACNPLIYSIFNKDFRKAFRKLVSCISDSTVYL